MTEAEQAGSRELDTWQSALTRRLRTLLRIAPLHRLELGKGKRGELFAEQDLRALALRVLDVAIEEMGLGSGASMADLKEALWPLVLEMDSSLAQAEGEVVAEAVVEALLNEGARRQAFSESYAALSAEGVTQRVLAFHLLREREGADGEIAIFATTEGINLYAGMLEYPVEDAQIAEEAVLQAQVRRGRIADAVQTARRARLRSIEYEQSIVGFLETSRRDVNQVDWVREVLGLIDRALTHLTDRLETEREILRSVEAHLDTVENAETGEQLFGLRRSLDECVNRHMHLHHRLIGANRTYLDEHERQAFRPRPVAPLPDLEAGVLRPALSLPAGVLAACTDSLLAALMRPHPPRAPRLLNLVDRLLAPRRQEREPEFERLPPELEALGADPQRFDACDYDAVAALLAALPPETTLGDLLANSRQKGLSDAARRLLVWSVLQHYGGAGAVGSSPTALAVEPVGHALEDRDYFGDELRIARLAAGIGHGR